MKIHTNTISADDVQAAAKTLGRGVKLDLMPKGSRSHSHGFEVSLAGKPGKDRHGITRRYSTGGAYGSTDGTYRACTWVEWGDFIAELFKLDPAAKVGPYRGAREFLSMTYRDAEQRDEFGQRQDVCHAPHATAWDEALYDVEAVADFCEGYEDAENGGPEPETYPANDWRVSGYRMAQTNAAEDARRAANRNRGW